MSADDRGPYGVCLGDTLRRFDVPGILPRSYTAEVGAVMLAIGIGLGLALGML